MTRSTRVQLALAGNSDNVLGRGESQESQSDEHSALIACEKVQRRCCPWAARRGGDRLRVAEHHRRMDGLAAAEPL